MPTLTFNQFQKDLQDKGIDPKIAYFLTMIYEQQADQAKQMKEMATLLSEFADHLAGFAQLRLADQHTLRSIRRRLGDANMVNSESVLDEPKKN